MVCCWARSGQFDATAFYHWGEATAEEPCRNGNVWTYDKVNTLFKFREETVCEYQKPLHLMNYLLYTYGYKGDWALDLCAGSGSFAAACLRYSYNVIAVEKDEERCAGIEARLATCLTENEDNEVLSDATRQKNAREDAAQQKENEKLVEELAQDIAEEEEDENA